jgi:peroxiredoxin
MKLVALVALLAAAIAGPCAATADPFTELALIRRNPPRPAPDFSVPGLGAQPVRLKDFRGKVVFLNFWATWCPPCKEEMPSMERLYRRYKDRGLTILALSVDADGAAAVAAFVKSLGLTFPIGLDPRMDVANRYGIRALPGSFLIDRASNVVAVAIGPRTWDNQPARAVIEDLLK